MALVFPFILLRSAPPSLPGSTFIHYIKKINALIPELSFPHLPHIVSFSLPLSLARFSRLVPKPTIN